ncbi:MAG: cell wall anchor protein, partial [Oscillospiraceae bacterium]|nr:cell wall anchor protein [Oscillospiraceae bacterium]
DFEQDGFHYTLVELLEQELPEYEERQHTETVTLESKKKDMESVLALLPQEREFITDDGFVGTLKVQLDTVRVEVAGYGSSTKDISATRSYPNLLSQDTQYIPKTIEDNGKTLTLQNIDWQTDNTASMDGYALADRYTAVATYTGSATSSYVKGYTVTADYTGTVSRIALDKVRYVAIYEGAAIEPVVAEPDTAPVAFQWTYVLVPLGIVAAAGAGIGIAVLLKHRKENEDSDEEDTE